MAIISLLTSLVHLNRIERALIFADEFDKVPPLGRCNTSHYTDPTHFLIWCLCSKQTAQLYEVSWQSHWTMRQEREPCSKESKAKERRKQGPCWPWMCHISPEWTTSRLLLCEREKKYFVCHCYFRFLLLAANCRKLRTHGMFWELLLIN